MPTRTPPTPPATLDDAVADLVRACWDCEVERAARANRRGPATRTAPRLIFTRADQRRFKKRFFLTRAEHRALKERFTRAMRTLRRQFDQAARARKQRAADGRDQLETSGQFGRRFLTPLMKIADCYASVFDHRRRPPREGRPPGFKPKPPRRGTSGRPAIKGTPEILQAWLSEIETLKEQREAQAMKSGYSATLRQHIFDYFEKKYLDDGRPRLEATRLATAKKTGPLFASMKVKLSRLNPSRRR